ncbi:PASTA domain-containing protein [Cellulomonas biazotea]|uniref:PASTA domain-containing protein n=1 Tax=Cellulomonas biazotea TaxID=1709 RepID=A0A402DN18_9CELL|nr:hypothetical protein [Cellulomonas biazotea]GCE75517.1 hypothetical protein CBZ_05730 [Cellulomonas biazotea]
MNLPTTRTRLAAGAAAAALAATAFLAGCSDSGAEDEPTAAETTAEATTDDAAASGKVEVIDQTNLLLATAQDTLEARDLTVEVVDSTGQGRTVDDPTLWVVVAQDPLTGEVDAGSVVTLDVRRTDDPAS